MFRCVAVRKVEESTKPPATMAANVVPPAPAEEWVKKREVEDIKVEGTKNYDDAMDVEQTPVQLPLKETTKQANEHPPNQPTSTSTDRNEAQDVSRVP